MKSIHNRAAVILAICLASVCLAASKTDDAQFEVIKQEYLDTDVAGLIQINSPKDVLDKRKALIRYVWGAKGFPSSKQPASVQTNIEDSRYARLFNGNLKQIDKITVEMEKGLNSIAFHFIPKKCNDKLIIYHQGHRGDFVLGIDTIEACLEKGYAVMAFSMPLLGMNNKPVVYHERFGRFLFTRHHHLTLLENPLQYFMEPMAVGLNYAARFNYKAVYMTGISGGGWTTTLYAAIDTRIRRSYPVAGSLPIYLRSNSGRDWGDYEQTVGDLYRTTNYLELYVMGAYGKGRSQIQLLNQYDACCFAGITNRTYEKIVAEKVANLGKGRFRLFLDSSHKEHKISEPVLAVIFEDLAGDIHF